MNIYFTFIYAVTFIITASVAHSASSAASSVLPISDERINQCYSDYPFFRDAVINISDEDFANQAKASKRKALIKKEYEKSPAEIRSCTDDLIQAAKEQKDPDDTKYTISKMKEITSIVYSPATKKGSKASKGVRD